MPRLLLLLLGFTFSLHAATTYRVTTTREGHQQSTKFCRVTVDGADARVDYDLAPGAAKTVDRVVSRDGGATWIGINDDLHTWFKVENGLPLVAVSHYAWFAAQGAVKNLEVSPRRITYTMRHGVRSKHAIDVEVTPAASLARALWPARAIFRTGLADVDAAAPALDAFPQQLTVRVTRQLDGGPAMTETIAMSVDDVRTTTVPAKFFERPASYREQAPVIATPGAIAR